MWAHADKTQGPWLIISVLEFCLNFLVFLASCDKCNFNSAYYYQLQIRSADEPMTTCTFILFKFGLLNWFECFSPKVYR